MAEIVLGIGTSHGPMLVTDPEVWGARIPADEASRHAWRGESWTFEMLREARKTENRGAETTRAVWDERKSRCRDAIEVLATVFEETSPDVAVIIGNDQMEIFDERLIPAFSVFLGDTITNYEFSPERMAKLPVGIDVAVPGYIPAGGAEYQGKPDLAQAIVEQAMADQYDLAVMNSLPKAETPHAFGFVYRHIMRDRPVPSVPALINTFYPPNQPTVSRCESLGKSIKKAIERWDSDARVALIASGGLTHFVIDEELDQMFLDCLHAGNMARLANVGEAVFKDGTSEIKNWVPVAGAMSDMGIKPTVVDYVPCYRTDAGTGNAMGFVYWRT